MAIDPATAATELQMNAEQLGEFMEAAFDRPFTWVIERNEFDGVRVRQPIGGTDLRPGGTVSGPTLMSLADAISYMAVLARIGPQALAVTTNMNINFLRRPKATDVVAEATVLKMGRTLALVEVTMYSDGGDPGDLDRPVAHAVVTYSMALLQQGGDG
ncbi:MAG: PaaI family thioesterase [Acidimicrobiales bacterium]